MTTTACTHTGPFDGAMPCVLEDHPTNPGGHSYQAAWAPDGTHDDTTPED